MSPLQKYRQAYQPILPAILTDLNFLIASKGDATASVDHAEDLRKIFKHTYAAPLVQFEKNKTKNTALALRIGVVLSGGQAAGGHNVILGLFDAMQKMNTNSILIGFIGGPGGIVANKFKELKADELLHFRNMGGFDLIGSGRTKIETIEQLESSLRTINEHKLDGLVVIGGDDSNTNAAILAEYLVENQCKTKVIGCPKTIDGDLKNAQIEISFGFDTACKTYSEMIGNICRDALSAKKYYHFIKLMGRSASHITLECALQCQPNLALIGEEIKRHQLTLDTIVKMIVDLIIRRSVEKKDYGVILIPEGLIEFVPEIKNLIEDLNNILSQSDHGVQIDQAKEIAEKKELLYQWISSPSQTTFDSLPEKIQLQLLKERDPHGNVQVSHIETEQLLIAKVKQMLNKMPHYQGKFNPVSHFFGYEGRSAFPTNFDANYCYSLGHVAALLIQSGLTGYMAAVNQLHLHPSQWTVSGVPFTMMMNLEKRHGKQKPVIQKALVTLNDKPFKQFETLRRGWETVDCYRFPGPIQFAGPDEICNQTTITLQRQ